MSRSGRDDLLTPPHRAGPYLQIVGSGGKITGSSPRAPRVPSYASKIASSVAPPRGARIVRLSYREPRRPTRPPVGSAPHGVGPGRASRLLAARLRRWGSRRSQVRAGSRQTPLHRRLIAPVVHQATARPWITWTSTSTTAATSSMWMKPPSVYELTSPSAQRTRSTKTKVQSMATPGVWVADVRPNEKEAGQSLRFVRPVGSNGSLNLPFRVGLEFPLEPPGVWAPRGGAATGARRTRRSVTHPAFGRGLPGARDRHRAGERAPSAIPQMRWD